MIKKVSSKKKKELVKAIKNPNRYFRFDVGRYGGEVAMGEITKAQYDYWSDKGQDEFSDYMSQIGFDVIAANKDIPKEAEAIINAFCEAKDVIQANRKEVAKRVQHARKIMGFGIEIKDDWENKETSIGFLKNED